MTKIGAIRPGSEKTGPSSVRQGGLAATVASRYGLVVAWLVLIAVFSILKPNLFFQVTNFQTILGSQAVLLVLTLGLLAPLTAGEFDLSVGGVMTVTSVIIGDLSVHQHWPIGLAILAGLAFSLAIGVFNAVVVVIVGVQSIVVTLGVGTLLAGVALGITDLAIGGISESLVNVARQPVFGIQAAFYYAVALTIVVWYVMKLTPLGRYLYFVGANPEVARLAGVPVRRIRMGTLISSSFIGGVAGVLLTGILGSSDPTTGTSFLLPAFAGAFLGSTGIQPGRFNAWGTFVAVYFLVTGITGLQLLGLTGWVNQAFYGGSLAAAVVFSRLATVAAERRRRSQAIAAS